MDELSFIKQLSEWNIKSRDAIVPTTASILLYGQHTKTRIISIDHESVVYACIKNMEISDKLYKDLTEKMKYDDLQVLKFITDTYEQYLKDIRKSIKQLQSLWSRNWCQFRATQVIEELEYDNLIAICDLASYRIVPIELILKVCFDIKSNYGDHRRKKDKTEISIDPRVLKVYNEKKEYMSRTTVHPKNSATS